MSPNFYNRGCPNAGLSEAQEGGAQLKLLNMKRDSKWCSKSSCTSFTDSGNTFDSEDVEFDEPARQCSAKVNLYLQPTVWYILGDGSRRWGWRVVPRHMHRMKKPEIRLGLFLELGASWVSIIRDYVKATTSLTSPKTGFSGKIKAVTLILAGGSTPFGRL